MGTYRPENKLDTTERRRRVIELRREGHSYERIAQRLEEEFGAGRLPKSWGRSYVGQDLRRSLKQAESDLEESASDMLKLELSRLDALQSNLWEKAMEGQVTAVDRILAIMKRRAKYLGLDAPEKIEQAVSFMESEEYQKAVATMMEALKEYPEARAKVAEALAGDE